MFDRELPEPISFVATVIERLQMQAETSQAKSCLHWPRLRNAAKAEAVEWPQFASQQKTSADRSSG